MADQTESKGLPDTYLLDRLVDEMTIAHPDFTKGRQVMDTCVDRHIGGRNALYLVTGESGCGKSRLMEDMVKRHESKRDREGKTIPLVLVTCPTTPVRGNLARAILDALGAGNVPRETEGDYQKRILRLCRECKVRVLILDEFQHVYQNLTDLQMQTTCAWLKNLMHKDVANVSIVITGLPDCREVFKTADELKRRISLCAEMNRFHWTKEMGDARLVNILRGYYQVLKMHVDLPDISGAEFAYRWYLASGGMFGNLIVILRRSFELLRISQSCGLTMEIFDQAYKDEIWDKQKESIGDFFPFSRSFTPLVSKNDLNRAKSIVSTSEPAPRRHVARKQKKVRQVGRVQLEAGASNDRKNEKKEAA